MQSIDHTQQPTPNVTLSVSMTEGDALALAQFLKRVGWSDWRRNAIDDVEASVRTAELVSKHFPHLKIFARARNRQHAFRLMDFGVRFHIRETYVSSIEMAIQVLETLGLSKHEAVDTAKRFRAHDEGTMQRQYAIKDDEKKLIESAQESSQQLEHLFESDVTESAPSDPPARAASS